MSSVDPKIKNFFMQNKTIIETNSAKPYGPTSCLDSQSVKVLLNVIIKKAVPVTIRM